MSQRKGNKLDQMNNGHMHPNINTIKLISKDELPYYLNDNRYLLNNHRPELNSYHKCFSSILILHTETCNIWTHLLGAIATIFFAIYHLFNYTHSVFEGIQFSIFFLGALFCFIFSSLYHTCICHSEDICKSFAKVDYVGVIVLITSSYFPWINAAFKCHTTFRNFYISAIFLPSFVSICVVLNDKFSHPRYLSLRAALFAALGLVGVIPAVHYFYSDNFAGTPHATVFYAISMTIAYLIGAIFYVVQMPERFKPGFFDIWGQSHTILHICVMIGVWTCYQGALSLSLARIKLIC